MPVRDGRHGRIPYPEGLNPMHMAEFPCREPFSGRRKSAAPRKRNMIAWRRRLIPRVMQCPRQAFGLGGSKKVQRRRGEFTR